MNNMITPLQRQVLSRYKNDYLVKLYSEMDLRRRFHKNLRTQLGIETSKQFKNVIIEELYQRGVR